MEVIRSGGVLVVGEGVACLGVLMSCMWAAAWMRVAVWGFVGVGGARGVGDASGGSGDVGCVGRGVGAVVGGVRVVTGRWAC